MTGPHSEWLKPIEQRYLSDDPGQTPATVKVAAVLSGLNALAAAGVAAVYLPMTVELVRDQPPGWGTNILFVPLVGVLGAALAVVFVIGVRAIPTRRWVRLPVRSALALGGLAVLAFVLVVLGTVEATTNTDETTAGDVAFLAVRSGVTTASAFGMVLLLRGRRTARWLAIRRHQAATGSAA